MDWRATFHAERFVKDLQRYIDEDHPMFPASDGRLRALHNYLFFSRIDPASVKPLLGPRREAKEVEDWLLRRDVVAMAVVTSFYRRLDRGHDEATAALWDAVAYAAVHFSFDPLYGQSHTQTGAEIADLFIDPKLSACAESKAALERYMEPMMAAWKKRVTRKATTTMMAIFLRHLGAAGGDRFFLEWGSMDENERVSLLELAADYKGFSAASRRRMVAALQEESLDVSEAAHKALAALGAPLDKLDMGAPKEEWAGALKDLRAWAK